MENDYSDDDIVISGISGIFPMSDSLDEFKKNLFDGIDMTTDNHDKWPPEGGLPHKLGVLKNANKFDAQFFGVIRKHCNSLDPITRLFLERGLEAIFDAGVNPLELRGSNTGVFLNIAILETEMLLMSSNENEAYGIMGRNRALNANRLSYWLDLKGPSYCADSLYNGCLDCLEQACMQLKDGKIEAALVGSGQTIFHPESTIQYDALNLLSPDGNTRAFDINADGYGRAEAISVMFLQRRKDARRVHAQVLGVLTQSMATLPSLLQEPLQENWHKLFKQFYSECKVDPKDVSYLEADGISNAHLDAVELNAAAEYFCDGKTPENPLLIGTVKSNMGHAEGAANMCGIAKLIITLEQECIPANLHYKNPNPLIRELIRGKMKVVTENTPLPGDLVAMNSFGLGQTYGHLLLRKHPRGKILSDIKEKDIPVPYIIFGSSRNEDGINKVLDFVEAAPFDPEYCNLVNKSFSQFLPGHMYRGFTVLPAEDNPIRDSGHFSGEKRPVWFILSGMGSQWPTMGRDLLSIPSYRKSIETSAKVLKNHGVDLVHLLTHDDPSVLGNIMHCFVTVVASQIALTDVLTDIGIKPDGIIGHSVGETSASYVDGCLTHEQTILSAYYRGRASLETKVVKGVMAAVGVGYQKMKNMVPEGIDIACHNGPDSCTLSGPADLVEDYVKKLTAEGIFARTVNVNDIPYHSKYIKEITPKMYDYLKNVIPDGRERSSKWLSTSYPESEWSSIRARTCNADYHIHNLLSPVLFEEASRHIPENAITIEIAPHGLLRAILQRSLPKCTNIALTNRNARNQKHVLLKAIGNLYLNGLSPDVKAFYPPIEYPVSRGTAFTGHLITWDHSESWSNFEQLKQENQKHATFNLQLDLDNGVDLALKQDGNIALPHSTYLVKVWEVLARVNDKSIEDCPVTFTDVIFHKNPVIGRNCDLTLEVIIQPATGNFEIIHSRREQNDLLVTGNIKTNDDKTNSEEPRAENENTRKISKNEFYMDLLQYGHEYGEVLRPISSVTTGDKIWKAEAVLKKDAVLLLQAVIQLSTYKNNNLSAKISTVRKIRKIKCDFENLNSNTDELTYELCTDSIKCKNFEIQGFYFSSEPRQPVKFKNEELNKTVLPLPPRDDTLKLQFIQFSGSEMEGKQVSYTGHEGQQLIIGLGMADKNSGAINADKILRWNVPAHWNEEQAAPIPLHYSLAYYAVHIAAQIDSSQSVVITEGFNKMGIACLRVALATETEVYTVVSSQEDGEELSSLLPQLSPQRIIVNQMKTSEQLCLLLKKRCPKGYNVIINTGAPDFVLHGIQCLRPFGCMIEMSNKLFSTRGKITNSYDYLISASLISCAGADLCEAAEDVKKDVQRYLKEGISKGIVLPFNPKIRDWDDITTVRLESLLKDSTRFACREDEAYLILGGDPYSWLAIAEWFVARDAKHIIIVHENATPNGTIMEKIKHMQEKCRVVVKSAQELTPKLVDHIFEVSRVKIALTLLLPFGPDPLEETIEILSNKDTWLVTISPPSLEVSELNQKKSLEGKKLLTIFWSQPLNGRTQSFLQTLDRLLKMEKNNVVFVCEDKDDVTDSEDPYEEILPKKIEEILTYAKTIPLEVSVTEMKTKNMGNKYSKENSPLFVIPGLHRDVIVESFKQSLNPVFIIDFPILMCTTVGEYASLIIPKIKSAARGPYILIGEGWGGAVALESARLLERMGEETQLFLLAATPYDILNKWTSSDELDLILLTRLFQVDPEELKKETSWSERLNLCLASLPSDNEKLISQGLLSIREKAVSLLNFNDKTPIKGEITCVSRQEIPRKAMAWMSSKGIPSLTIVKPSEPILSEDVFNMIAQRLTRRNLKR